MQSEIEAKFLNVNHDLIRVKLIELGGACHKPLRLMRRVVIDNELMKQKDAFLRVRDEGETVTMTYKKFDELSVDGAKEIEVVVSDFDVTIQLLAETGLSYRSFQESKRETWNLNDVEIMLDEWPWLNPYIEIEGGSENQIRDVAEKLGFSWDDAVFGDVMAAYRSQYPHLTDKDTVGNIPEVRFDSPLPEMFET